MEKLAVYATDKLGLHVSIYLLERNHFMGSGAKKLTTPFRKELS
jgi:hypothetical protein